jgi:hypothetical protein
MSDTFTIFGFAIIVSFYPKTIAIAIAFPIPIPALSWKVGADPAPVDVSICPEVPSEIAPKEPEELTCT